MLDASQTFNEVARSLGVSSEIQFKLGWNNLRAAYEFAHSSWDDDYNLNFSYIIQSSKNLNFRTGVLIHGEDDLLPAARELLHYNPKEFYRQCGDSFISQLYAGVSLVFRLNLHFNSWIEKEQFSNLFTKSTGLQNVLGLLLSEREDLNFNLKLAAIQLGGEPEQLYKLFEDHGIQLNSDGYINYNCGKNLAQRKVCLGLVEEIIAYSQHQIPPQLTGPAKLHLINPVIEPLTNLGIEPIYFPHEEKNQLARQQLNEQYLNDRDYQQLISNYLDLLRLNSSQESLQLQGKLQTLAGKFKQLLAEYVATQNDLDACFHSLANCPNTMKRFAKVRHGLISNADIQLLNYLRTNQYRLSIGPLSYITPLTTVICGVFPIDTLQNYLAQCINGDTLAVTSRPFQLTYANDGQQLWISGGQIDSRIIAIDVDAVNFRTSEPLQRYTYLNSEFFLGRLEFSPYANSSYSFNQPVSITQRKGV